MIEIDLGALEHGPHANLIREMAQVGRWLAGRYEFAYPHELEDMVQKIWDANKECLARR